MENDLYSTEFLSACSMPGDITTVGMKKEVYVFGGVKWFSMLSFAANILMKRQGKRNGYKNDLYCLNLGTYSDCLLC